MTTMTLKETDLLRMPIPEGVDGAAIRHALEQAQDLSARRVGTAEQERRLRTIADAAGMLSRDPKQLQEAITLTKIADPDLADMPDLIELRLAALLKQRHMDVLTCEIRRLSQLAPQNPDVRNLLLDFTQKYNLRREIPASPRMHAAIWGAAPSSLRDGIRYLSLSVKQKYLPEKACRKLYEHSKLSSIPYVQFISRILWGLDARNYLHSLNQMKSAAGSQQEHGFAEVARQANEMVYSQAPLEDFEGGDGGKLILASHAGIAESFVFKALPDFGLPRSIIANSVNPDSDLYYNVSVSSPDAAMKFLKLIKMVRKEPRCCLIFPDGGSGEMAKVSVLGIPFGIGKGAAMLAYHGRMTPYFCATQWSDFTLRKLVKAGPVVDPGESYAEYEERLNAFYGSCLGDILTGPPEDIGALIFPFSRWLWEDEARSRGENSRKRSDGAREN